MLSARMRAPARATAVAARTALRAWRRPSAPRCVRAMASRPPGGSGKGDEDKSWEEIAEDASKVGKALWGKLKSGVERAIAKAGDVPPASKSRKTEQAEIYQEPKARDNVPSGKDLAQTFGGGLLGRALGGMVSNALGSLADAVEKAQEETRDAYAAAAAAIMADRGVRGALGEPLEVTPPMSQSSSTSIINGVRSKNISLIMIVSGPRGRGQASVQAVESSQGPRKLDVAVQTADGRVIKVDTSRGGRGGRRVDDDDDEVVVEAEWTDARGGK
ncbi:unnamed protein product [Pedinophyceae sp. YPF-701]|nr:unnamed protein product [Pedinophyceae sp. YPF-701]